MTIFVNNQEAKSLIQNHIDGTIFTVTFIKRTNGEIRVMNCRRGVVKGTNGQGRSFNPASRNLISVYDMQLQEHRFISLENLKLIKKNSHTYIVK